MAARQPARASHELRKAPLSPRYRWNYTTPGGTTRRNGYHANSAARALRVSWPEMERIIADALDEKPETLWPDRYVDGVPRKYLPRKQAGG